MSAKYPGTALPTFADKLEKLIGKEDALYIEREDRQAVLDLLAKINETYAAIQNVSQTFTVPGWGTFQFGKWYPYPAGQPVFTGFGTPTNVSFSWKREGGSLKVMGKFTAGTNTATEARISLPLSLTSDATLVPSIMMAGTGLQSGFAATYFGMYILIESNVGYVTIGAQNSTASGETKTNGNNWGNNNVMMVQFEIPISGWN